jgi:hypothetical protein
MPSRSAWESLTNTASEKIGDAVDSAKSFYKSAQRGAASAAAARASQKPAQTSTPTVRRDTSPTPTGTDTATKDLSAANAVNTVSEAPSQIDKAIASMDH